MLYRVDYGTKIMGRQKTFKSSLLVWNQLELLLRLQMSIQISCQENNQNKIITSLFQEMVQAASPFE